MLRFDDPEHPANVPRLEYLQAELIELRSNIDAMVKRGSWQACVAARRLAMQIRAEIDALRNVSDDQPFDPTDLDDIVAQVAAMPDAVFRHPVIVDRVARAAH